ncbi:MAG: glycoside hydrolase family 71/99-like protein [Armatimonas sp.]
MKPLLIAHYMPWYMARPYSQVWGWHWTMNAFNPEKQTGGKREIASHYYPLIGPYDSGDPTVQEYHLLLMKLSGIDGVIVDWYGLSDYLDYSFLHKNTQALIQTANRLDLKYAICYEDQTIPRLIEGKKLTAEERVPQARRELDWLRKNWFREPNYVRVQGKPLLLSFGFDGLTDAEWTEVLKDGTDAQIYVSEHNRRTVAQGSFDWPIPKEYPASLDRFEKQRVGQSISIPVAFPRFHDIYAEGKAQPALGRIPDDNGRTWTSTLQRALKSNAPIVQLATWNDWGEGTGIEPTQEFGYRDLEVVQRLRGEKADLHLPLRLYRLRQLQTGNPALTKDLDRVSGLLGKKASAQAVQALAQLEKNYHQ